MDLLHIGIFYQYLADCLLNSIMHLSFLILNHLQRVFCMNDLEYMAIMDCVLFYFH